MNKCISLLIVSVGIFSGLFSFAFAQTVPTLTITLSSTTPASKSVQVGTQHVDLAKITLKATGGDVHLNGIYLDTSNPAGLSNFINLFLYRSTTYVGAVPNQSSSPNLVRFGDVVIGNGKTRTYSVHGTVSDLAAGQVRVGFSGFTFSTLESPVIVGIPIYANTMTFADYAGNQIPTPTPSPTGGPIPTPATQPDTKPSIVTPVSLGFTSLASIGLTEGDTISVSSPDDPNIYIVNDCGHKRLFLNPAIFGFYGHLGGFAAVKSVDASLINSMVTSGLVRNCEINDPKVYGVETTGEDTGILHWLNISGEQAVADDPDFFKRVFCINSREFNWYTQGSVYTSANQVPDYTR